MAFIKHFCLLALLLCLHSAAQDQDAPNWAPFNGEIILSTLVRPPLQHEEISSSYTFFCCLSFFLGTTEQLCQDVECGKGKCVSNSSYPFNFICKCDAGWKRTRLDNEDDLKFLPCVIPNCEFLSSSLFSNCCPRLSGVTENRTSLCRFRSVLVHAGTSTTSTSSLQPVFL